MKENILKLRSDGKTYNEIKEILKCSKGTIAYHCGEGQKEKSRIRLNKNRQVLCECGNNKYKESYFCKKCDFKNKRDIILDKTILEFEKDYYNNHRYVIIRKYARKFLEELSIKKECNICKFDHYVECCHIKPIHSFSKETKLKEVNSINNLVFLCPNHHKMFDLGLITL